MWVMLEVRNPAAQERAISVIAELSEGTWKVFEDT